MLVLQHDTTMTTTVQEEHLHQAGGLTQSRNRKKLLSQEVIIRRYFTAGFPMHQCNMHSPGWMPSKEEHGELSLLFLVSEEFIFGKELQFELVLRTLLIAVALVHTSLIEGVVFN